jgi:hypothetical protein
MAMYKDDIHHFGEIISFQEEKSSISLSGEISYIDGGFPIYLSEEEALWALGIGRRNFWWIIE